MKKLKLFVLILFILNPLISHTDKPSVILENLTWMDADWNQRLYYALVAEDGTLVTPAMVFRNGKSANPLVLTSFIGQGSAPYGGSWRSYLPLIAHEHTLE